jgi:hypothetical protein
MQDAVFRLSTPDGGVCYLRKPVHCESNPVNSRKIPMLSPTPQLKPAAVRTLGIGLAMPINASTLRAAACIGILVLSAPASGNPLQDQATRRGTNAAGLDSDVPKSCGVTTERRWGKHRGVLCGMDANGNPVIISIHRSMRFPAITTRASE